MHGTTHQRPIDRFADEARALAPTAGHASFLQAMVRERVVAEDWLVSIDGNRYSVPFVLIGKTVQVVREGGSLGHPAPRRRGGRARGAGRTRSVERAPRARSGRGGAQRSAALLGAARIASGGSGA